MENAGKLAVMDERGRELRYLTEHYRDLQGVGYGSGVGCRGAGDGVGKCIDRDARPKALADVAYSRCAWTCRGEVRILGPELV